MLIKEYPTDAEVCSGYIDNNENMLHYDLEVKETRFATNRDNEDNIVVWIGCTQDE